MHGRSVRIFVIAMVLGTLLGVLAAMCYILDPHGEEDIWENWGDSGTP